MGILTNTLFSEWRPHFEGQSQRVKVNQGLEIMFHIFFAPDPLRLARIAIVKLFLINQMPLCP
jgi:hypothetical protein